MQTYGDPPAILSMFAVLLLIPSGHRVTAVQTHYLLMHTQTYTDTHIRLSSTVNNTACCIYAAGNAPVCRKPFQHGLDKAHDAVHRVYYGYVGKLKSCYPRKICELCLNPTFSYVT